MDSISLLSHDFIDLNTSIQIPQLNYLVLKHVAVIAFESIVNTSCGSSLSAIYR